MNLIWRFLWVMFFSRFSTHIHPLDESTIRFRVLPTDADLLLHMNNGRYFSLMDLARIHFMIRSQFFSRLRQQKIYPVVASEMIRFRKSLNLFQSYTIHTRLLGWDDKFFYIAHSFKRGEEHYALSIIKACFLTKTFKGSLPTNTILHLLNMDQPSPPLPNFVTHWNQADREFFADHKLTV